MPLLKKHAGLAVWLYVFVTKFTANLLTYICRLYMYIYAGLSSLSAAWHQLCTLKYYRVLSYNVCCLTLTNMTLKGGGHSAEFTTVTGSCKTCSTFPSYVQCHSAILGHFTSDQSTNGCMDRATVNWPRHKNILPMSWWAGTETSLVPQAIRLYACRCPAKQQDIYYPKINPMASEPHDAKTNEEENGWIWSSW